MTNEEFKALPWNCCEGCGEPLPDYDEPATCECEIMQSTAKMCDQAIANCVAFNDKQLLFFAELTERLHTAAKYEINSRGLLCK